MGGIGDVSKVKSRIFTLKRAIGQLLNIASRMEFTAWSRVLVEVVGFSGM